MELRPYQSDAVIRTVEYATQNPTGSSILVGPPGLGKTIIAAAVLRIMAADQGMHALAISHRREIVGQTYEHLIKSGVPAEMIGVIMANDTRHNPKAPIQVASLDSLHRRGLPKADVLLTDESHRDASVGRRKLRRLYPNTFRVGLTATPWRLDGRSLRDDYDDMHIISTPSELILDGWLSAPRTFTVRPDSLPDLSQVPTRGGDFDLVSLGEAVNQPKLTGDIVSHWLKLAEGRRTVVFAVNIAHSKEIVARFQAAGIWAAHIDQTTPLKQRRIVLDALREGVILVVSCVNILSEGWDCPPCKCVVQARPTKSLTLHIQQTGRCMRPWEGVTPLILDHAGNMIAQRHGLPQMDREWSLETVGRGVYHAGSGVAPAKMCPCCGAVVPSGCATCPECQLVFPRVDLTHEKEGELENYQCIIGTVEKQDELMKILAFARKKAMANPHEWAQRVYQKKYHEPVSP